MKNSFLKKKLNAFTLTELLVALAIIGILILLALPKYSSFITKAKSLEAQKGLELIYEQQRSNYYIHNKYVEDINNLDFEMVGKKKNYKFEIKEVTPSSFTARATAINDFDKDGIMNIWEIDQDKNLVEITKD